MSKRAKAEPFFNNKATQSVAAFLCTDVAYQIYKDGAEKFGTLELKYPGYIPGNPDPDPNAKLQIALSNQQVLAEARRFVEYAIAYGNRGTSH